MHLKILLVCFLLSGSGSAQDVYSLYSRLAPSSAANGNGAQLGIGFDSTNQATSHLMFDVDMSLVREPKSYVGDGWTIRAQGEGLIGIGDWWIGGGLVSGRHSNSQYIKYQYQPLGSIHFRPNLKADVYASLLFPGSGNGNAVRGYRFGYRGILRGEKSSRYGLFVQVEYTRFGFRTEFGERRTAGVWTTGLGLSRIVEGRRADKSRLIK